ncbi:MAG: class I SAM-dependent methyltransferase, partial [Clostridiales bacterium]|nr:class I SAM-dependent methyltransferase [Clostridiales bacterium]
QEFREQFDIVTSRAVADLGTLCELCLPFLRPGGVFLAMKGPDCREEKNAAGRCISILGGQLRQDYVYTIPETEVTHCVVRVEKTRPTPAKYPRRFAQIKKSPL